MESTRRVGASNVMYVNFITHTISTGMLLFVDKVTIISRVVA